MKTQNPIIGRSRGSAGGMTFCKNYDKNVARAKAFEVSNPNTPAQQVQRTYFRSLSALVASFTDEQLRTLFPSKPKTMSRRNALSRQIAKWYEVNDTEKTIDFAEISTLGNAPGMDMGETSCTFGNGQIAIVLDQSVSANINLGDYYFIAAIVNETKGQIFLGLDNGLVSEGSILMDIPSGWETTDSIHAIPLVTDQKDATNLRSFGSFIIKTRAEKKGSDIHKG